MLLSLILAYTTHEKIQKKLHKTSKIKISAPTLNEEFELTVKSDYVLDIQDYFEYIL